MKVWGFKVYVLGSWSTLIRVDVNNKNVDQGVSRQEPCHVHEKVQRAPAIQLRAGLLGSMSALGA